MVDGIDAAEAAYAQARLPGPAARLPHEARHGQPPDDLRHRLFRDPGHRRGHRVQRRAARMAEGRRRAGQRGAGDRRRRSRLRRLQGGGPAARCAAVLRPCGRGRGQDRACAVPHRAHPQDPHAGGRLLRLRAPHAAVRLSQRMGAASQRRARHPGRHGDRRAAGQVDRRAREVFRQGLGARRGRRHRRRHRHAAHPLHEPPGLPAALSRHHAGAAGRPSGAAQRSGSRTSPPARRC